MLGQWAWTITPSQLGIGNGRGWTNFHPAGCLILMHDHLNPNDEIISIQADLVQLDDAAREISNKRVALFRRLNALRSETRVLPPETLSLIFQYACVPREIPMTKSGLRIGNPPSERRLYPVFLGSISKSWRQVAWSTPQLWVELSLSVCGDKAQTFAALLDLYLTNVRGLPITLRIHFRDAYPPNLDNDPVAHVFFRQENLRKLGVLKIGSPPTSWLHNFDGPFSQLVKMRLADGLLLASTHFLKDAPMLRRISLRGASVPLKAPGSLLTTLKLEGVTTAVVLRCLLESPNLIELRYIFPTPVPRFPEDDDSAGEEVPPEMPEVLTLHHLQILLWPFKLNRASDTFLHRIRLPALRSLTWDQRGEPLTGEFFPGIWTFFENLSSAPLMTLHLYGVFDIHLVFVKHIYHQNPRIENLFLELCDEETLYVALASLVPGWNGEGPPDERRYLTKLRALEVRGCAAENNYRMARVLGEYFGDIVADLLVGRTAADLNSSLCINLVFSKMTEVLWTAETKERLQEFSRSSAAVQLLEDGELLEWL